MCNAFFEFEYLSADFNKRQQALVALNTLDPERNLAAADRWRDFHVGINLHAEQSNLLRKEPWFGDDFNRQCKDPKSITKWNKLLADIFHNPSFKLLPDQLDAIRAFVNASSLVHVIHGLAGTAKTTVIGIIAGLAAASGKLLALCASEHFTIDNSVQEMCTLAQIFSQEESSIGHGVVRWYTIGDCLSFLKWVISNNSPLLTIYSELTMKDPRELTELEHLKLAFATSFNYKLGVKGGKFSLLQHHPVFGVLNVKSLGDKITDLGYERPLDFQTQMQALASTIDGPELIRAKEHEAAFARDPDKVPSMYTEIETRWLLAETELREKALKTLPDDSSLGRANRQIMTILLRPKHEKRRLSTKDDTEILHRLRTVVEIGLKSAAVVCGTPYRLSDPFLQNHFKWDVTIIEEAEAMNIDYADVVIAARPDARLIMVGDVYQPGPFVTTNSEGQVPNSAAIQKQSVLEKSLHLGMSTSLLRTNFRGVKPIIDFISRDYYDGKLIAGLGIERPLSRNFQICLQSNFGKAAVVTKTFPILFLSTPNTKESTVGSGHSVVNTVSVSIVRQVSARRCESGISMEDQLILSPYLGQVKAYRNNSGLPKQTIATTENIARAMTISLDKGYAAEVVVLDVTRTDAWGFVLENYKLEEAPTRARTGIIVVVNYYTKLDKAPHQHRKKFDKLHTACRQLWAVPGTQTKQNMVCS